VPSKVYQARRSDREGIKLDLSLSQLHIPFYAVLSAIIYALFVSIWVFSAFLCSSKGLPLFILKAPRWLGVEDSSKCLCYRAVRT
jgi:hypothetical protein